MTFDWAYRSKSIARKSVALFIVTAFVFTTVSEPWAQSSFWEQQRSSRQNLYKQTDPQTAEAKALLSSVSWPKEAAHPLFGSFKLSSQLGSILETHLAASSELEPEKIRPLTLYHIQDAHGVYGAQYNASQIIDGLAAAFKEQDQPKAPLLVCQEGGLKSVNTDWLSSFPFPEIKREVAHAHLRMGNLTGEEYLALVRLPGFVKLRGVENKDLYFDNLDSRRNTIEARLQASKYIASLQARMNVVKENIYPSSLLDLDRKFRAYSDKKITFVQYLQELARRSSSPISRGEFPNVHATLLLSDMESVLDLDALREERTTLVDVMAEHLSLDSLKELVAKASEMRLGHVNPRVFYQGLVSIAGLLRQKGVVVPTDNLRQYVAYLELMERVNHEQLLLETDQLKKRLLEHYAYNDQIWRLVNLDQRLQQEADLWGLAMGPDQFAGYRKEGPQDFIGVEKYLLAQERSLGLSPVPVSEPVNLQPWLEKRPLIHRYYEFALERNLVLVQNALNAMKETGASRAVLVAGGFHTQGMTDLLRQMGVNYVVIQPRFEAYQPVAEDQLLQISYSYDFSESVGSVREQNRLDITGPLAQDLSKQIALQESIDGVVSMVLSRFGNERAANAEALEKWWAEARGIIPIDVRRAIELEKGKSRQVVLFGRAAGEPVALVYDFRNKIMVLIGENSDLSDA
ncbi:MAG TPA: hypothetical protein P5079_05985, partial [Elusimicrobiota bacterium]|nr:hypothetical protein [Elusimicrobiota bacterium]